MKENENENSYLFNCDERYKKFFGWKCENVLKISPVEKGETKSKKKHERSFLQFKSTFIHSR